MSRHTEDMSKEWTFAPMRGQFLSACLNDLSQEEADCKNNNFMQESVAYGIHWLLVFKLKASQRTGG